MERGSDSDSWLMRMSSLMGELEEVGEEEEEDDRTRLDAGLDLVNEAVAVEPAVELEGAGWLADASVSDRADS